MSDKEYSMGNVRKPYLEVLLTVVTLGGIYYLIWLYRVYSEVRARSTSVTRVTPNMAVGFMFIPLLNIFWLLYISVDLPRAIASMQVKDPPTCDRLDSGLVTLLMVVANSMILLWIVAGLTSYYFLLSYFVFVHTVRLIFMSIAIVISQRTLNGHWKAHMKDNQR